MALENAKTRITSVKKIYESAPRGGECLVEIYGKSIGRKYELVDPSVTLGRDPDNHIVIDTDSVSRRHARIESYSGEKYLVDLDSTNGTYLNDKIAIRTRLSSGDFIKIGDTIFKFLSGQNIESAYHEEIYRMTIHDGLTQIPNKRYLEEFLEKEFSRSTRYRRHLAVLMLDIDRFKDVNDRYGHLTGDYVLKELASAIRERIRREELFARYGGEEFVIVLPESDPTQAQEFAEIVRRLVEQHPFEFEGNHIPITVSIGIANLEETTEGQEDLIRRADEKLYAAKRGGRNAVIC